MLLIFLLAALLSGGFWASVKLMHFFVTFLQANFGIAVVSLAPQDVILTLLKIDLLLVFVVILPFLLIITINYVRPALYEEERRYFKYVPIIYFFSVAGCLFGWFICTRVFIPYFLKFSGLIAVSNAWSISNIISFIIFTLLAFLIVFNTPILFSILFNNNILKIREIRFIRKVVIAISAIIGAIFSPPDIVSQLIIALPMYLLFEITVQWNIFKKYRQQKRLEKDNKKISKNKKAKKT